MNLNYVRHTIFLSHVYMKMHLDAFLVGNQMLNLIQCLFGKERHLKYKPVFLSHIC